MTTLTVMRSYQKITQYPYIMWYGQSRITVLIPVQFLDVSQITDIKRSDISVEYLISSEKDIATGIRLTMCVATP